MVGQASKEVLEQEFISDALILQRRVEIK